MVANKDLGKQNRVAIITGGTTGIGGATARELAKLGYRLMLIALSDPDGIVDELTRAGASVHFLQIDLSDSENAAKVIVGKTIALWDRLDLLVNCAGTISHHELGEVTDINWEKIFAVNLKAPFFMMQQAIPYLRASRGNIINVSSINAWDPAKRNHLYDSLKAALNNLTKGFSLELRDSGVRVNAIMPGGVRTPLVDQWLRDYLGREPTPSDLDSPAIAQPDQIAKVIASLASDDMSWVNGVELPVDGGFRLG